MISPQLTGINHITLVVSDIDQSFNFYKNILGFKPLCKWDNGAYFLVGEDWFCLNVDKNIRINAGYTHYAFTVTADEFEEVCKHLTKSNVTTFKENTSPGDSIYFLDPDGHKLEIHTGDWKTRIKDKKINHGNWKNIIWYI
ncbi:MAG: VOC family protein [Neisseriaceae bacterium]|jgi:catechol 2,3-dioxygenase-like lactoylglutathione lyase family enzyme